MVGEINLRTYALLYYSIRQLYGFSFHVIPNARYVDATSVIYTRAHVTYHNRPLSVFAGRATDTGVDVLRVPERVRGVLQLRGGRAVRGRFVQDVFRGVVLFRADRAVQPEPWADVERRVFHVLRAAAQERRTSGHRAHAPVPGGNARSDRRAAATVSRRTVLLARVPVRVPDLLALLHGHGAARHRDRVLDQRHGPNGGLHAGIRPVLRAVPRLRARQRSGRNDERERERRRRWRPEHRRRPSVADTVVRHLRRAVHARRTREPGVRAGNVAPMGVQHRTRHYGRVPVVRDRILAGRPARVRHLVPDRRTLGRTVHVRIAHVLYVHGRRTFVQGGIILYIICAFSL